jgi:hypothetical protein
LNHFFALRNVLIEALVRLNTEDKFVLITESKSDFSIRINKLSFLIPALLTRISIFSKSFKTSSTSLVA